jgi:hypothetical protein
MRSGFQVGFRIFDAKGGGLWVIYVEEDGRVSWKHEVQSREEGERMIRTIISLLRKRALN